MPVLTRWCQTVRSGLGWALVRCAVVLILGFEPTVLAQWVPVESIAELELFRSAANGTVAAVSGYTTSGDGGGGEFVWDSSDGSVPDRAMSVGLAGAPSRGRWKRLRVSPINVRWFGAKGDGTTNDRTAIQAALDCALRLRGGTVMLPTGNYLIAEATSGGGLLIGSNVTLEGMGGGSIIKFRLGRPSFAIANRGSASGIGDYNITIRRLVINCDSSGASGVLFKNVVSSQIEAVSVLSPTITAIALMNGGLSHGGTRRTTERITVSQCDLAGFLRIGLGIWGAAGCTVVDNRATGAPGAICYVAREGAQDCIFSGNLAAATSSLNRVYGFVAQAGPNDVATGGEFTRAIVFRENRTKNVDYGAYLTGATNAWLSNILLHGNSFAGTGTLSVGVAVDLARGIVIENNSLRGFGVSLAAGRWTSPGGIKALWVNANEFDSEASMRLYGNIGGSFSGNRVTSKETIAYLYGWRHSLVEDNIFLSGDMTRSGAGVVIAPHLSDPSIGNSLSDNIALDTRVIKLPFTAVVLAETSGMNLAKENLGVSLGTNVPTAFEVGSGNTLRNNLGNLRK